MIAQFPQELVDMIIDFLHDDGTSLYTCSLVCNGWLESSRVHKFWLVAIGRDGRSLDECPIAAPYVRRLSFLSHHPFAFSAGLSKCTNLRKLILTFRHMEHCEIPNIPEIRSALPFDRLKSLSLTQCCFQDGCHFFNLLCSFPLLNSLSITKVGWKADNFLNVGLPNSPIIFPPFAGALCTYEFEPGKNYEKPILGFLASLLSEARFRTIKVLKGYRSRSTGSVEALNKLLVLCGAHLQKLDLRSFKVHDQSTQIFRWISLPTNFAIDPDFITDLTYNTNLRKFITRRIPDSSTVAAWLLPTFSTIRSCALSYIRITAGCPVTWITAHWAELDALFANIERFPNMQTFEVIIESNSARVEALTEDRGSIMLPMLQSRGILIWRHVSFSRYYIFDLVKSNFRRTNGA